MPELSYASGSSEVPLIGETIGSFFDRIVATYPETDAVVSKSQRWRLTYRQLHDEVERAARAFMASGVEKGDRVGIWSPNNVEWMIVQYATAKIGAIMVNINPAYRAHELAYSLRQSGVSVLVAAPKFRQTDYVGILREVLPDLPDLRKTIVLGDERNEGFLSWADFIELSDLVSRNALLERSAVLEFDDPINIQYTSGTTGFPKGATLSHHNILNNGFFIGERMLLTEHDKVCLPVPFYHCFGMVLGTLAFMTHGGTIVIPSETFDPKASLEAVQEEQCTALYGVPTMFIAELEHPDFGDYDLSTLRTGIMAGAPCPEEIMRKVVAQMHMRQLTICYGMTETSPVSFQTEADDDLEHRVATVGSIHPHVECKIIDPDNGQVVPRGTAGELCSRGYLVMLGYWNNLDATSEAIDQARWMHTGDLAVMRDDGYVNIVGRIKDMIIRGGENIYPREVEEFLYTHPCISDVQVIGVPDAKYGEEVCAWIILKEAQTPTDEDIRNFCRGKIATVKIPRYIRFSDGYPMTVTGKAQKYKMREISITELGLQSEAKIQTA
ncbi:MAG: AMP-binding protein [SAR202 cluster bacterium]|nr:AMP-binding protein [SAR202 cluster bacterium]|tara:strand:- start:356 stop:2017 length:1662 start_codon:yes stop_codon:yes gene_type:complete